MEVPNKLKIELPYDPAIPLLGIYLEKTVIQKDTCWEGDARGRRYGDICIHIADSLCNTAETKTTL